MDYSQVPYDTLIRQKGRPPNIGLMLGPCGPLLVTLQIPFSWLFLAFTFISYFDERTKIHRKHQPMFSKYFWGLFWACVSIRAAAAFNLGNVSDVDVVLLFYTTLGLAWAVYSFRMEYSLYKAAEAVTG